MKENHRGANNWMAQAKIGDRENYKADVPGSSDVIIENRPGDGRAGSMRLPARAVYDAVTRPI